MELGDRAVAGQERVWGRPLFPQAPSLPCICSWAPSSLAPSFPPLSALDPCPQAQSVDLGPQRVTLSSSARLLTGVSSLAPPPRPGPHGDSRLRCQQSGCPPPVRVSGTLSSSGVTPFGSHIPRLPARLSPLVIQRQGFNGWNLEGRSEQPIWRGARCPSGFLGDLCQTTPLLCPRKPFTSAEGSEHQGSQGASRHLQRAEAALPCGAGVNDIRTQTVKAGKYRG